MKRGTGVALATTLLVVGATLLSGVAAGTVGTTNQVGDMESDLVIIEATVTADGTATLEIQHAIELSDGNDTAAFEELAADIEANESRYLDRFGGRMNDTVAAAERATGREMAVTDFAVRTNTTSLGAEYGLVTYSASWINFAVVDEDRLRIGDALAGLFIDGDTRFVLSWPADYQVASVTPGPTDQSATQVVWEGPREFEADQPSVVVTPDETTETETTTAAGLTTETPPASGPPWLLLGLILLVLVAGITWYWRETRAETPATSTDTITEKTAGPSETADGPPEALLSNEERVAQYLDSVGGRAKQQEIVDALDWTEAKTSQVLSEMESTGAVEKFRIGRENVVKLSDAADESE